MRPETSTTHLESKPEYYDVPGRFCPGTYTAVTAGISRQCASSLRVTVWYDETATNVQCFRR